MLIVEYNNHDFFFSPINCFLAWRFWKSIYSSFFLSNSCWTSDGKYVCICECVFFSSHFISFRFWLRLYISMWCSGVRKRKRAFVDNDHERIVHTYYILFQIDFVEREKKRTTNEFVMYGWSRSSQLSEMMSIFSHSSSCSFPSEKTRNHKERWRKEYESRTESKWGALWTRSFSNPFEIPWNNTQRKKHVCMKHRERKKKQNETKFSFFYLFFSYRAYNYTGDLNG